MNEESISKRLIDAAEVYKNSAVKYALAPSTGAPNESQAYDDSHKAMVQLAQEVEKELNGLRTGQTIVDPQFKDRYTELVADLFNAIKQRDVYKKALELACTENDWLLNNFPATDIPGDWNIVDERTSQYWIDLAQEES
jgi:hypothetical protein